MTGGKAPLMIRSCGWNTPRQGSNLLGHVVRSTPLISLLTLCFLVSSPARIEAQSCAECSVAANFNATPISGGSTLWFSSVLDLKGVGSQPVTVLFTASAINFTANGTPYTLSAPSALLTFSPTAASVTT